MIRLASINNPLITRLTPALPPNVRFLFENNGINSGSDGGLGLIVGGTYVSYSTDYAKSGSYSLKVVQNSATTDLFKYPNTGNFLLNTTGITISFWFRYSYYPVTTQMEYFFYHTGGAQDGSNTTFSGSKFEILSNLSNNINFEFGLTSAGVQNIVGITGVNTINTWHHVGWSINSSGVWTLYFDGSLVSTPNATANYTSVLNKRCMTQFSAYNTTNQGIFTLGCTRSYTQIGWSGNIDDFRYYKRALTGTELLALYNAGN
jgi:hypothetical protein